MHRVFYQISLSAPVENMPKKQLKPTKNIWRNGFLRDDAGPEFLRCRRTPPKRIERDTSSRGGAGGSILVEVSTLLGDVIHGVTVNQWPT